MDVLRVTERPASYEMVRWDGSEEAAAWAVGRFGDAAVVETGEDGRRRLRMGGAWEIPYGSWLLDRWGNFELVEPGMLSGQWQAVAAPLEE